MCLLLQAELGTAQTGTLVLTPGATLQPVVGSGTKGNGSNRNSAADKLLRSPAGVAYDSAGNLYIADRNNHMVRRAAKDGTIQIVAGTGRQGFSGDGAAATQAELDSPSGVGLDSKGNLYIVDSRNHRIRMVDLSGVITTIAGDGVAGFSDDDSLATKAHLRSPEGLSLGPDDTLYIADSGNHRVRKISKAGLITTVAGNGEEGFGGDGGIATTAELDTPTSLALDGNGQLYIADRDNERIRIVDVNGLIRTVAGSSSHSYVGGRGAAASASLTRPNGVAIDSSGNIFVADEGNHRIQQIGPTVFGTVAGNGMQGVSGDAGPVLEGELDSPAALAVDESGDVVFSDRGNARIRRIASSLIDYGDVAVGHSGSPVPVTITNSGAGSLLVEEITVSTGFSANSGDCGDLPFTLPSRGHCVTQVSPVSVVSGVTTGSFVVSGDGMLQILPLKVMGITSGKKQYTTETKIDTGGSIQYVGLPLVITAHVSSIESQGTPTGSIGFSDGDASIGSAVLGVDGTAKLSTSSLSPGDHALAATYAGDESYLASTSKILNQRISMLSDFLLVADSSGMSKSIKAGDTATFYFSLMPQAGSFDYPVSFQAVGLPSGVTYSFEPSSLVPGSDGKVIALMVKTAVLPLKQPAKKLDSALFLGFLVIPIAFSLRRRLLILFVGVGVTFLMYGCGNGGLFGGSKEVTGEKKGDSQNYSLVISGQAVGYGGVTLVHSIPATLTVVPK